MDLFSDKAKVLTSLEDVVVPDELKFRLSTGIDPVDRAFGSTDGQNYGLVRGSSMLFGGDPGVGKSTLLLQILGTMSKNGVKCVYDSAEESAAQLKMATERIGLAPNDNFLVGNIPEVTMLASAIEQMGADILIIDSIQGLRIATNDGRPGSSSQLGESCDALIKLAKDKLIPLIIICQLCKDGTFKGPRGLEHNVDIAGYLREGKNPEKYRVFYLEKNRFGPTHTEILFPWLGGKYDFSPEAIQELSGEDIKEKIQRFRKNELARRAEAARKLAINEANLPEYDDSTKIAISVNNFRRHGSDNVEVLKQLLDETREKFGHFLVTESDARAFGVDDERMKEILREFATDVRFRMESEDPLVIRI